MKNFEILLSLLRCPCCKASAFIGKETSNYLICESCGVKYPISAGRPVLLDPENKVFCQDDYLKQKRTTGHTRRYIWERFIPTPSVNLARQRVLSKVRKILSEMSALVVLVVGSGHQRHWLDKSLGASTSLQVVYSDIDTAADVDLFCDGHNLPFVNDIFDAVITTAVLEHVLYPERVATEIVRVLKTGGLLYSELPFMQQVHEGAYDFTRFSMSGHRRLFNSMTELDSGMVAGPGTALAWVIESFAISFVVRPILRKTIKAFIRLFFGWIKYFDYFLINKPGAFDGASCTYMLGCKMNVNVPDTEIIARYVGADAFSHK